ncbi:MAG: hypothetical protein WDW36_006957 [Sanguina aurantia]
MSVNSNRIVVVAVAFTLVATFYSLSELHRLSTLHASGDTAKFVTHDGSQTQITIVKGFGGDVVKWGTEHSQPTAAACCQACKDFKPAGPDDSTCNVWVWCGDAAGCMKQFNQCWLKHLIHPEASKPARQGANVAWTSGTIGVDINADPASLSPKLKGPPRKYHIVTTTQGSATHWQVRVHYYWLNKVKAVCEANGDCEMGGFTRLLHSGQADDLMDEMPTVVVDPLPSSMVEHSWYIVLNRPYAFVQWTQKVKIPERYVLMSEPDHIFLRPVPNFMNGDVPAAFPFFYIEPAKAENVKITQKFTGPLSKKELEMLAPVGNSPTFMTMDQMVTIMPIWMNTSIAIFKDAEANRVWGWVQEMYGFTIAAYLGGIRKVDLFLHMMAQPPWDTSLELGPHKPYYILHYTYGMDYKLTGEFTPGKFGEWRFDKRTYSSRPPPRHMGDPPKDMKNDLVRRLIDSFNEAFEALGCWDDYAATGKITPCKTAGAGVAKALTSTAGQASVAAASDASTAVTGASTVAHTAGTATV